MLWYPKYIYLLWFFMNSIKSIIFHLFIFFSLNTYADITMEGGGVLLDHFEEKNVALPDHLKNIPLTPQENTYLPNDNISTDIETESLN
jgi:hypothetical protein